MNKKIELLIEGTGIQVVSIHTCKYCSSEFSLYDIEKHVLDAEGFSYPDFCPTCRFRMLYSYINDKHLYHRKDDLSGTNIVSTITPEFEGLVYKAEEYKQMVLDDFGLTFGRDITDDIFADFISLYRAFPRSSKLSYPALENAEYASHLGWAKDVYMSFCVFYSENVYYSQNILFECRNIFSSYDVTKSTNIYECGLINSCHEIAYSYNIFDSSHLLFCRNMQNCNDCIFCSNQVGSRYMVYNKQYTEEEYKKIKDTILTKMTEPGGLENIEKEFEKFLGSTGVDPSCISVNSETAVGERVYNSKKSANVFAVPKSLEESVNVFETGGGIRLINCVASGLNAENIVGSCSAGINSSGIYFCYATVENCHNIYYSSDIEACEECMFCIGLKGKRYCILNREYSKEEYFLLKEKIISKLKSEGKWGQFLGFEFSPFPYNDTLTYDYFKVHRVIYSDGTEEIIDKNALGVVRVSSDTFIADAELDLGGEIKIPIKWRTKNKEINIPTGISTIDGSDITGNIADNDIISKAIICEESGRPFRILKAELDYTRKRGFPLPSFHPEIRIDTLISKRPLGELFISRSDLGGKEILSVFREKPGFKVYSSEEYTDSMFS